MRVYYKCHYDGKECDKVVPRFDDKGNLIPEPNTEIKSKYGHIAANDCLERGWDICDKCPRNYSLSCCCYGDLKIGG